MRGAELKYPCIICHGNVGWWQMGLKRRSSNKAGGATLVLVHTDCCINNFVGDSLQGAADDKQPKRRKSMPVSQSGMVASRSAAQLPCHASATTVLEVGHFAAVINSQQRMWLYS